MGLSTTLATNAIVEDQGSPVCLMLIGYDPDLIRKYAFEHDLVTRNVVYMECYPFDHKQQARQRTAQVVVGLLFSQVRMQGLEPWTYGLKVVFFPIS